MASKQEMAVMIQAVKLGHITKEQVQTCLNSQQEQGGDLFDLVVASGFMKRDQIAFIINRAKESVGGGDPLEGKKDPIPGFTIKEKIGQGGMAVIYRARNKEGQEVAIKILRPTHAQNPAFIQAFFNEAKFMISLEHPNLIKGYRVGKAGNLVLMIMEYVPSRSVQEILDKEGPFKEAVALHVVTQLAETLDYLKTQGITHQDVKPENTLMTADGSIKLCDLGFAKTVSESGGQQDTTSGTVQYMSPEQAKGRTDVDIRSDIYSLGATLYHLIVGNVPFSGKTEMDIMSKQVLDGLNSNEVKNRHISSHMHYFIEKMMAKEREIRYQTPREFIEDVRSQLSAIKTLVFNPEDLAAFQEPDKSASTRTSRISARSRTSTRAKRTSTSRSTRRR